MATAKQLAARKLFVARVRSGEFARSAKRKPAVKREKASTPATAKIRALLKRISVIDDAIARFPDMAPGAKRGYKAEKTQILKKIVEIYAVEKSLAESPKKNPLSRVKVASPPQRPKGTRAKPSPRLVKRRKATNRAPAGYYANPLEPGFQKPSKREKLMFIYVVQSWGSMTGAWFNIAGFSDSSDAIQYAHAYSKLHPTKKIRVIDNFA